MRFIEIINRKKFVLISVFLFLYVVINLFEGERGLVSYYNNQNKINELLIKKENLISQLNLIEKKNSLLTENIDKDYLEILYREKFLVGKKDEKIYVK